MSNKHTQQEIASQVEAEVNEATPEKRAVKRGRHSAAKKTATAAMFAAIAIVCKLIGKTLMLTPSFTVSFIYLPWLIAGATLGPIYGMTVGLVSDLLGNMIFGTPLNPLTVVSNTLFPLPIAVLYRLPWKGGDYFKTIAGALSSLVLCTLGIGSFALYWYYGYIDSMGFFEYILIYRTPQVGVLAVNIVALCLLIKPLGRVGLYPVGKSEGTGLVGLAFAVFALYALYAAAMLIVTIGGLGRAQTYVILSAVYVLFNMLAATPFTRGRLRTAILICETLTALAIALTATITAGGVRPWLKYILSAAAIVAAAACVVAALTVRMRARRKNL